MVYFSLILSYSFEYLSDCFAALEGSMSGGKDSSHRENLGAALDFLSKLPVSELYLSRSLNGCGENFGNLISSCSEKKRFLEVAEILVRIEPWAGSVQRAWDWFCRYKIASLGGLTADELVSQERYEDVAAYIAHISIGGWS